MSNPRRSRDGRPERSGDAPALATRISSLIVSLLLAACSGGLPHRSVRQIEGTIPLSAEISSLRILSSLGSLEIDAGPGPDLSYKGETLRAAQSAEDLAALEAVPSEFLIERPNPRVLLLRTPPIPPALDPLSSFLGIEARIRVPAAIAVEIEIEGSGHVTVVGRAAPVSIRTGRGDLRVSQCRGPARLETGAGMTIADRHAGDLEARAGKGDLQVWLAAPGERVVLSTGRGTIQCHVPESAGFTVEGRTLEGKAGSFGFALETEDLPGNGRRLTGRNGDGRTRILLETGRGSVSIEPYAF